MNKVRKAASIPVVLNDFGCDITRQACWEIRARFQASSGNPDSANWPGYEAERKGVGTNRRGCGNSFYSLADSLSKDVLCEFYTSLSK